MTNLKSLSMATAGATLIALAIGAAAQAAVLEFDNLTTDPGIQITNGYGGFNWNNFFVVNRDVIPLSGYNKAAVSGKYSAYNGLAEKASIQSNSIFDFNGAFLTGAWNDGLSVLVEGLKNGVSLYSQTVVVDTTSPKWFDFNFLGIDELKFSSFGGVENPNVSGGRGPHFAMDNFTINEVKSVPEPASTLGFLAFGAMGLGSILKGKQQKVKA
ncbi:hypothetical protein [Floridanema evergladense]|uniref:PEP-CTERM sorting domain-containing protein n=1 Tax=Floridaenema evergladense BLCC-F167 TaxID=3153639 RepID=A0ABV4WXF4_9CYAN